MNMAQKRTWYSLVISLAGISLGVIAMLNKGSTSDYPKFSLLGLSLTIPLILMVILSWLIPGKQYDERDKRIERKALIFGIFGVFAFLGGAIALLLINNPMGSINVRQVILLFYLAAFVWFFISSVAAVIQYGWKIKGVRS